MNIEIVDNPATRIETDWSDIARRLSELHPGKALKIRIADLTKAKTSTSRRSAIIVALVRHGASPVTKIDGDFIYISRKNGAA